MNKRIVSSKTLVDPEEKWAFDESEEEPLSSGYRAGEEEKDESSLRHEYVKCIKLYWIELCLDYSLNILNLQ
jgi:hypothetical protein